MTNDEPVFKQAKANAELLSGVRPVLTAPERHITYMHSFSRHIHRLLSKTTCRVRYMFCQCWCALANEPIVLILLPLGLRYLSFRSTFRVRAV